MADSRPDDGAKVFSVRIVSIDYYTAPPIPGVDVCYSSFQGEKVNEVPVIRVYGSTPAGQKACLHIHRSFPYMYVPCSDIPLNLQHEGDGYTNAVALALEKALKLKGNATSKKQHVHDCRLVRAKRFYGYHSSEELFVKIYLYYPHDVFRAANLLLAGAVFDKSLQPHESHIPFILQFLVDYNLYGMGHIHLSKMKFRNPVPDVFHPRKFSCCSQQILEDTRSCTQAELGGGRSLDSLLWLASTIPCDWMWQFPGALDTPSSVEFCCIKRQSVCELEGDATIDEILNQRFKSYTSLSQAHSDVKMVQSLIPIWEEEYERTGILEAAIRPDPGKPVPGDVLKTLLHDLEFQLRLADLCTKSEASLPSGENDLSSTDGENLVEGEVLRCSTLKSEPVECPANNDVMGLLLLQGSASEEKTIATPFERKDVCPKLLSIEEIQSSEVIGTLDPKTTDTEALGLLRWLATSQAAEDINSDDELVRETILSPLLPATTIDKVLEKASIEYGSASQKECQDILDSIQDFLDLDGLKEKDSLSIEQKQCTESSSGIKISQGDDSHSSPGLFGNSSRMGGESHRYFMHQALESTGMSVNNKRKRKRLLWGSLPFSTTGKVNDELKADACVKENEHYVSSTALTKNEKGPDSVTENAEGDVYEASASVACSVRDLMRRKRCLRVAQKDCAYSGVRKVHLEDEEQKEDDIILPKRLDFHTVEYDDQVNEPLRSLNLGPTLANQQKEFHGAHVIGNLHSGFLVHQEEPFGSVGDSSLLFGAHPPPRDAGKEDLKCLSNSGRQDSAASTCEADAHKEFDVRSLASADAIASNVHNFRSHSTSVNSFLKVTSSDNRLDQVNPADPNCLSGSPSKNETFARSNNDHQCEPEVKSHAEKSNVFPYQSFMGMNVLVDATFLKNENDCDPEEVSAFSAHGTLISTGVHINQRTADLIGMTPCKKPPISERKDGACASFRHPLSGKGLDELLPFFEKDFPEKERDYHKFPADSDTNAQQEVVMGVPTHYQNDGSMLYLLTPVLSPPSGDCVNIWLRHGNKDNSGETSAASIEPLIVTGPSRIRSESSSPVDDLTALTKNTVSHGTPILNKVPQQVNENLNKDIQSPNNEIQRLFLMEGKNEKQIECIDSPADISQISGPNRRSRSTPLSQIGFRDPASVGAGQQVTLLSIEVHAGSRGDLLPDPRFDAINVVALAFQNDNDSAIEVHVLLHCNNLSYQRSSDGLCGCKVLVFSEEQHLFSHFIMMLGSIDPDILVGWDVQGGSLGFLAERAAYLGIGLLNSISRTPLETKIGYGESETSDKGMLDTVLQEPLIADAGLIEDAIIEDEWGRTHASGVHVGGRIVLNVWRLMRGEVKLNMYTVEAVAEAVLRLKVPSIPCKVLTKWFSSGSGQARYRCVEYVIQRARLNLDIMNQLDMINRTSELARVFGIDFFSVLSRGSQYRVESMLLRLAHTQNYLAISPGSQQVAGQPAMECLPLVMEPESGFYADPVVVLDFQSLYPSMIIAYNLCFCTCLGNVTPSKAHRLGVSSFSPDLCSLRDLKDEMLLTPNGVIYVPPKVRKGVLPRLLEEILSTRIMVKQAMKKLVPSQQVLHRIFNARQLALKLIANVTYGYTAAGFSGRMPCAELADSIVQCGRSTLEKAISLVNANDKWKAKVIYGDTDSMFVLLKGCSIQESFQIGREIASAVTAMNPDPVTLKLEKVYHPCFLLTKKRYVGYSYESPDQTEPLFDAKGIETVRRDTCGAVAKIMEQSLRIFFEHQDISKVKMYLQRQWTRILSGRVSIQDFVFAKEVRLGTYSTRHSSSLPPAAIVATKAMRTDPRAEPRYAERVPYVVIHGEPGARLVDMVADPMDLLALDSPYRLNDIYYISKQIIPALQRVFGLVGADLSQWFSEMPRPVREAFAKHPLLAANPQRMRIDFYYLSKHCVLCGELVHASAHICNQCATNEVAAATAVIGRTAKLEREIQHLAAICRHCGGGDWLVEGGVKCTSLACPAFYERRKVQKELKGLSAVAADKGYYPKCTVEWF